MTYRRHLWWPIILLTSLPGALCTGDCPAAALHRDICYRVVLNKLSYNEARRQCSVAGGRLAVVRDADISDFLLQMLDPEQTTAVYIGLTDQVTEGTYVWDDGTHLGAFSNWATNGKGGSLSATRDCVLYDVTSGTWLARDCNERQPYVCEYGDFEPVPISGEWSDWVHSYSTPYPGDNELLDVLRQTFPHICQSPYDVQCRTRDDHLNWNETGDILLVPCSANQGLLCLNSDQSEGVCQKYELRFLCPPDKNECEDRASCPDPNSECINTYGGFICRCKGGYYMYDGKCIASRPCTGWGDPHYTSFDKRRFDFQGTCRYVLSELCQDVNKSDVLVPYRVLAKNEYRNRVQRDRRVSQTKSILVQAYGYSIELRQAGRVSINGVEHTSPIYLHNFGADHPGSFIEVRQTVDGVSLTTDFGLFVHFDGKNRFRLTLADDYSTKVCGLCGDFDGNPNNDFRLSNGSVTPDVNQFGNSWTDVALSDVGCEDGRTSNPECETLEEQMEVNRKCGVISDPEGPFLPCHGVVDPDEYEYGCTYDLCSDIHNEDLLCDAIAAYAEVCKQYGVIVSWRSEKLCPPTCLPHSYFSDLSTSCPNTCTDPTAATTCTIPPASGCVCDPGRLLSGDLCVDPEMCGCVSEDGAYHKLGDAWYQGNCTTLCECRDEGAIVCDDNVACHVDGSCVALPGGAKTCVCNPGYTGHPYNCTDINECSDDIDYCHDGADCINTDGSYECECKDGFNGNGFDCEDVDECLTNPCHVYATCVNEPGSYRCYCLSGYTGDGSYCQEILDPDLGNVSEGEKNGCSFYMEYCSDIATCVDLADGQFICQCPDGASGDGLKEGTGCQYPPCPDGTVEFNFNCYEFLETSTTFHDARKECQKMGGDLASLSTPGSLTFVREYADNHGLSGTFWIGYTDNLWSGTFVWLDGSVSSYTNWATGEPQQQPAHHCVFIDIGFNATYRFQTDNCDAAMNAICQQSRIPLGCPVGWLKTEDGDCVAQFNEKLSYFDAYMTCVTYGADLLSINDTEQLQDISNMFGSDSRPFWVGLNDGYFNSLDGEYQWTDGSTAVVQVTESTAGNVSCVVLDPTNQTYTARSCSDENLFVCLRRYGVHRGCPSGSMRFQNKCHKLKSDKQITRSEAMTSCNNMGGDLITIATEAKQTFVVEWIKRRQAEINYWIGLQETATNGNYIWSDGTEYEYANWDEGQPSDPNNNSCVYIEAPEQYKWADTTCDVNMAFICEYYNTPCQNNDDCHVNGQCYLGQCRCRTGYTGDGKDICTDVDECINSADICDTHATCINTAGSYRCVCNEGYTGSGDICVNLLACEGDADCHKNGHCNISRLCECKIGYEGNAKTNCTNIDECSLGIDECHVDADCIDTDGYYDCVCKDGYTGNGRECQDIPTSCDFLKRREPETESGLYVIDPDGPGGVAPFMVECDMRSDIGVTVVPHDASHKIKVSNYPDAESYEKMIKYTYGTVEQILTLINISGFCYQEMTFQCDNGAPLDGYYTDAAGFRRNKWGGSVTEGKCPCGEIGSCMLPGGSCNCDGSTSTTSYDYGKLTDRGQLPVTKLVFGRISGAMRAYHTLSSLYCGPDQFDIPTDCDEARWHYHVSYSTPVLIDVDGPKGDEAGNLSPFLVQCDMTSYLHVGVTEIPHNINTGHYEEPHSPGTYPLIYPVNIVFIQKLIELSAFCVQEAEYQCQNSRILGEEGRYAYVSRADGDPLDYWPGGYKKRNMCGCGVTRSCDHPDVTCNCDIMDGIKRRDFGSIIHKEDLPITSVTVTDVGENKTARYSIGWLKCAPTQFGIESSCQDYRYKNYTYSYTYLIDPDGPVYPHTPYTRDVAWNENRYVPNMFNRHVTEGNYNPDSVDFIIDNKVEFYSTNVAPFPVQCIFPTDQHIGITLIPSNKTEVPNDPQAVTVSYLNTDRLMIMKVITRSSYCIQTLQYTCDLDKSGSYWISHWDDSRHVYINATANQSCSNQAYNTLHLHDKQSLPVTGLWITDQQKTPTVGSLQCYETYPTCYSLHTDGFTVYGQYDNRLDVTRFVIDPDDVFGVEPFLVGCEFPLKTVLYPEFGSVDIIDNPEYHSPHAACTNFTYVAADFNQIQALVDVSGFCMQYMSYRCQYSPLSSHAYWLSHKGERMTGWAGSADGEECACGMTNTCDGGADVACNCDNNDRVLRQDHGLLVNKTHLPVSGVCYGFSDTVTESGSRRTINIVVGEMTCGPYQYDIRKNCQDLRHSHHTTTETWVIDPDGVGGERPFPAYCEMTYDPPLGVTVITHDQAECVSLDNSKTDVDIVYNAINKQQLHALTSGSIYCKQYMTYQCTNARLDIDDTYGWYDIDGNHIPYWAGNTDGVGCVGDDCRCNTAPPDEASSDGGWLYDKEHLPVGHVLLAANTHKNATRCLHVQPLRCYSVYKSCHDIKVNGAAVNPNGNQRYAIDPDGASGVEVMGVTCDFRTDSRIGISVVPHDGENFRVPESTPASLTQQMFYVSANTTQIQQLVRISKYCSQELYYSCKGLPLINDLDPVYSYFKTWDGKMSDCWAGADVRPVTGCACVLLETCPTNHTCHCDSLTSDLVKEGGLVTNKDVLPVSEVVFGGVSGSDMEGYVNIGSLRCAPMPFDLPMDCEDARLRGLQTGEVLIWPSEDVEPFLVYCDMGMVPYHGVTIIRTGLMANTPADGLVNVTYLESDLEQVRALVLQSKYCYLPLKLNCYGTQYLGVSDKNGFWGGDNIFHTYISGQSGHECTCGTADRCGGHDGKDNMKARSCNCDIGDFTWRADVGVIMNRDHLPVRQFVFDVHQTDNSTAHLTLDRLYCADTTFDLDECTMGYHDCHKWATCSNVQGPGRFSCTCQLGYQGLGVDGVWANGRECYDDDECALNVCPLEADCENTVGSFVCHCKTGFRKIAETECEDIDECKEGSHTCDVNARCHNTYGSFHCVCLDGYRGDGYTCEEIGQCKCWGDPHCVSFDRKFLHFQGACQYVLAQDGCVDHRPTTEPRFRVIQKNWREFASHAEDVSWTKEVYVLVYGYNITLGQNKAVYVDGFKSVRLPRQPDPEAHPDLIITTLGIYVHLKTDIGFEVFWDGKTKVEIIIRTQYKNSTCGLCGDYDGISEDDWTVGPQCPESAELPGQVTANNNLFGNSWLYEGDDTKSCQYDCDQPPDTVDCPEEREQVVEEMCDSLLDPEGRFKECIALMDQSELSLWHESCMIDVCSSEDDTSLGICASAEALAARCAEDIKVDIGNWRGPDFCPLTCPDGMQYVTCVPTCHLVCNSTETAGCVQDTCVEGCVCPNDTVSDGDTCVSKDQCGCVNNGSYYSVGDHMVSPGCTEDCYCPGPLMDLVCEDIRCHSDGQCHFRDGLYNCFCNDGYTGDGRHCKDIDECSADDPPCDVHATCNNTVGSFTCTCNDGFEGNGRDCRDIDECTIGDNDCDEHADCINTIGGYECHCNSGYHKTSSDSNICQDVDECATNRNDCDRKTTICENTDGSYKCTCKQGYKVLDALRCEDINECLNDTTNECHQHATCYNNLGGYTCVCNDGYRGDNGTVCTDIDECTHSDYNDCHEYANCTNTIGSYHCHCLDGYIGNGTLCRDIDECMTDPVDCLTEEEGGKCVNTPGSHQCICLPGYVGDGLIDGQGCRDVDECKTVIPPVCGANSNCTNVEGSYFCNCTSEDYYSPSNNGKDCIEKDTCSDPDFECSDFAVCLDGPQGAYCQCITGYKPSADDGATCEDINECEDTPDICVTDNNTECINTEGSFKCQCLEGYTRNPDNLQCEDVNECELEACDSITEVCTNTVGSYSCDCADGFERISQSNDTDCEDINECLLPDHCNCDPNADCYNTPGSCTCKCREGYTGNGMKCDEINKCDISYQLCDHNADCNQVGDSYQCTCHDGYRGDGYTCENIDECAENLDDCGNNTVCKDTPGGYYCECLPGFQGHCDQCLDINECETDLNTCDKNAVCINTPGSFYCQCLDGYLGDGHTCNDMDECILGLWSCDDNADCWNIPGGYECHCVAGYHLTRNRTCEDDDECSTSRHVCDIHAHCHNTPGSYKCTCMDGYTGDGTSCQADDPYKCGEKRCDPHAVCLLDPDEGWICVCLQGYTGSGYTKAGRPGCLENNPCSDSPCDDNAKCFNIDSKPVCICQDGYRGDGYSCEKISPCDDPFVCSMNAECLETDNADGYICQCIEGYHLEAESECQDTNECEELESACGDSMLCVNTEGSYNCICQSGYQLDTASNTCLDVDECEQGLADCDDKRRATCINTDGGYVCQCIEPQYTGDGKLCTELDEPDCGLVCEDNRYCKSRGVPQPTCVCKTGTSLHNGSCIDNDECEDYSPCHSHATCVNTSPGYTCTCDAGYYGNGLFCEDVNECTLGSGCDVHAKCENTEGSYECTCLSGYKGDGYTCTPIPAEEDICNCGVNGVCDSVQGLCRCNKGYIYVRSLTENKCQDENECERLGSCDPAAICKNLVGSYTCSCPSHMSGDGYNYCDENECLNGKALCSPHANCTDVKGWYTCQCVEGYTGDGFTCTPVLDPCSASDVQCGEHAGCVYQNGTATCVCDAGYEGDGEGCSDVNECDSANPAHDCDVNAVCINEDGGFYCQCYDGFVGSGKQCQDIDECSENLHGCSVNAFCQNTVGSYKCICQPGFVGDGYQCLAADGCVRDGQGCHQNATCLGTDAGGYLCRCEHGYTGDGYSCTDIDECTDGSHNCDNNAKCINTEGGYYCVCLDGYEGTGYICRDKNECWYPEWTTCDTTANCENTPGSYLCLCDDGYQMGTNGTCTDINECLQDVSNDCDKNADCVNTDGSYLCVCKDGYYGNGITCYDINECSLGLADCDHNTLCHNTPGSFTCHCLAGYIEVNDTCTNINECLDPALNRCHEAARCIDTDGGYYCQCNAGYHGNGIICVKPNPCDTPGVCLENATCVNLDDGYKCVCPSPMVGDGITVCYAPNECADGTADCDPNAVCEDTLDGYQCTCLPGFTGDGKVCTDIDECDPTSPGGGGHNCDTANGLECVNDPNGGYKCVCGQELLDSGACTAPNHCLTQTTCDEHAVCINKWDHYVCRCIDGYTGDGQSCHDIDECEEGLFYCVYGSECINTPGSYKCQCLDGYRADEDGRCIDIDECSESLDDCAENAYCTNIWGSYLCGCMPGYTGDGVSCDDVDECQDDIHPCHPHANCSNTPGSCICTCQNGYTGDGIYCEELDQCPDTTEVHCTTGTYCVQHSDQGANYTCQCKDGYKQDGHKVCSGSVCTQVCSDVDECAYSPGVCHEFAVCTNTEGHFVCQCTAGTVGNGRYCEDVDECATGTDGCAEQAECLNVFGSYECACRSGYVGDGFVCEQEDECLTGNNDCSDVADCVDLDGSYRCLCQDGYHGSGKECEDIDECAEQIDTCHHLAACVNTPGSYDCICIPGYTGNGTYCIDVDECRDDANNCSSYAECVNTPGSFICRCPSGFMSEDNHCVDIDECAVDDKNSECSNRDAVCSNTPGSYVCVCRTGYQFGADGKCHDINECAEGDPQSGGVCGEVGTCQNTEGSCICGCQPGYHTPDGSTCALCVDIDECTSSVFPHNCGVMEKCENTPGSYICLCRDGFSNRPPNCSDVNECELDKDVCGVGTCENNIGSYTCQCPQGYIFSDGTCTNVNECTLPSTHPNSHQCINADCIDSEGSYKCVCHAGYQDVSIHRCEDKNECNTPGICQPNGTCINTPGSYTCHCPPGYQSSGQRCTDVDECLEMPTICGDKETTVCINVEGSFKCICRQGYTWINGRCQDINECTETPDVCQEAVCINLYGSYSCGCPDGFANENGKCINIDECSEDHSCDENAICTDTAGSYSCKCRDGFHGNGRVCEPICKPGTCPSKQTCVVFDNKAHCVCKCQGTECLDLGEVCGTDGQTYESERQLQVTACRTGIDLRRNYRGPCRASCADVECSLGMVCDTVDERPMCVCPHCTADEQESGAICSDLDETFPSLCVLRMMQCSGEISDKFAHYGPCDTAKDCTYTPWSGWSACSVTCGEGQRVRKREVERYPLFGDGSCLEPLIQSASCYVKPCPGDLCEHHQCTRPGEYCVTDYRHGLPRCKCPSCDHLPPDYICAQIGKRIVTAYNKCTLLHYACISNQPFTVIHDGQCIDDQPNSPVECKMMPHVGKVHDSTDNCTSVHSVQTNHCVGGCGRVTGYCCVPVSFKYNLEKFVCGPSPRKVIQIEACGCVPDDLGDVAPVILHSDTED